MCFRGQNRIIGKSQRLLEKYQRDFSKSQRDFSVNRLPTEMNKYSFSGMWPDAMEIRKYLDIDGRLSWGLAPPSGASSASSATYLGVSFEE